MTEAERGEPGEPVEPADEPRGVRCPDCGCGHLPVWQTRPLPGGRVRRVRICRNCGRRVSTTEGLAGGGQGRAA